MRFTYVPKENGKREILTNLLDTNAYIQLKKKKGKKEKGYFQEFFFDNIKPRVERFFSFFADFNGMHSVIHICDWHGKVQKEQTRKTAVLSPIAYSHHEHKINATHAYAIENERIL